MWLINTKTGEEGWHICQIHQKEPCNLLVFVKEVGIWRIKYWYSLDIEIRPTTYKEDVDDYKKMKKLGFFTT